MKDAKFALLLALQSVAALVLVAVIVFWSGSWNAQRWIGLGIAVPSMILLFVARYQLGRSFSVTPQAKELVTQGLYSRIRNPMYLFSALMLSGVAVAVQIPYLFLIFLVLIPAQIIRARQEAKVLEGKFGDAYRAYKQKTWF